VFYRVIVARVGFTPYNIARNKTNFEIDCSSCQYNSDGLDARVKNFYSRNDLIIVTVTLPQFRLRWLQISCSVCVCMRVCVPKIMKVSREKTKLLQ